MKKILFWGALLTVLVIAPASTHAATFKAGENYRLDPEVTIDGNLYTAGANINIEGTVNGDLFVAGANVFIKGRINADLAAAGCQLNINGNIAGDARLAGGNINITNSVGGDLIIAGGQINVTSGVNIGKDVKIAGGKINFNGNTGGDVAIKGDQVYINGTIEKDLSIKADEITLGPNAVIKGNFDYYSMKEPVFKPEAKILGTTNFHKTEPEAKKFPMGLFLGLFTIGWFIKTVMLIVASLIVWYVANVHIKSMIKETSANFWKETLRGFILFIVLPAAIIISFITVIGAPLGIVALFVYLTFIFSAIIIEGLLFAQLALRYIFKKENYELNWWVIVLGVLALCLIKIIPLAGWIFTFILFLAALGGSSNYIYKKLRA